MKELAFFSINQYAFSVKRQQVAPKKIYMVQITKSMAEEATRKRVIRALENVAGEIPVERLTILTDHQEDGISIGGLTAHVQSFCEWLME